MPLLCPQITITWYPGEVGGGGDPPLVLLSPDHHVEDPSALEGMVEQIVDRANYVRGAAPDFFPRGNITTPLEWEEVREIPNAMLAQETALALLAGLPTVMGYLTIALAGRDTTWKVVPATIGRIRYRHAARKGLLYLNWSVSAGQISILVPGEEPPSIYAPGEIIEGPATSRGALLRGPNRTYPEE